MTRPDPTLPHTVVPGKIVDTMPPVRYCACGLLQSDPIHIKPPPLGLTVDEHRALDLTADLVNLVLGKIMGGGDTIVADTREFVAKIHDIQHMIMAQAAARAHPEQYRLLGQTIGDRP